jgi:chromate transport protein ChrA
VTLNTIRYVIPAVLVIVGFVILFTTDESLRWEGWAMCVGAGLAILLLNVLYRYGAQGDKERDEEEAAREYFAEHGRWPDEPR